jgi:hypothetical protein
VERARRLVGGRQRHRDEIPERRDSVAQLDDKRRVVRVFTTVAAFVLSSLALVMQLRTAKLTVPPPAPIGVIRFFATIVAAVAFFFMIATIAAAETCTAVKTPVGVKTIRDGRTVCDSRPTPTGIRTVCGSGTSATTCDTVRTPVGERTTCR